MWLKSFQDIGTNSWVYHGQIGLLSNWSATFPEKWVNWYTNSWIFAQKFVKSKTSNFRKINKKFSSNWCHFSEKMKLTVQCRKLLKTAITIFTENQHFFRQINVFSNGVPSSFHEISISVILSYLVLFHTVRSKYFSVAFSQKIHEKYVTG